MGTLPDLDVLIPYGGPVEDFTYHRGFSHSLLVLSAAAPVIGWALHKVQGLAGLKLWILMVWLVLITHPLLDAFTVYGTQLFWPLTEHPVSSSSMFIIDPAYTIWLLLGVVAVLSFSRTKTLGYRLNAIGLTVASSYLAWSMVAKAHVTDIAARSLEAQGITYTKILSTPAPFNTLLWRFVVMQENGYSEGYYSIFDAGKEMTFDAYESEERLLRPLRDNWHAERLKWFTHGFYKVSQNSPAIVITDLRMGVEGGYIFNFRVGEINSDGSVTPVNERVQSERDISRLPLIWKRIWDSSVSLAPK